MPIYFKTIIIAASMAAVFGFSASNIAAQSSGPAAFAAKQDIKNQVLAAMSDGKITLDERRVILSRAKNVLSAKEYVGLVDTMNRLSPPDHPLPENLNYAPVVDKQLMAQFPSPDISWINKSINNSKVGEALSNSKQSFAKEIMPQQTFVVKETTPKQTYIIKEIITKQTVVEAAPPKQSVVKATTSKPSVVKAATPKQSVVTMTKPNATAKTTDVVMLPPPPPLLPQENNSLPNTSTTGKARKTSKSDSPMPPMPPPERPQTRNTAADKPARQNMTDSPKKQPPTSDQVTIQQPTGLLNEAERSAITHSYADYSVPVLNTPAAALLTDRNSNAIQASFDQPLEPESGQSIIRQ